MSWQVSGDPLRLALVTFSGEIAVRTGNDVWCEIASVMERVGASIQDATGTFMRSGRGIQWKTFSFHPFGLRMFPAEEPKIELASKTFAVAILVRALVPSEKTQMLTTLLHTTFPCLVCTVAYGTANDELLFSPTRLASSTSTPADEIETRLLIGTIRLFGNDEVGQLATISDVLSKCRLTILDLLVTTGVGDRETYEFLEQAGGPLSENTISVAVFDPANFDESIFRREVTLAANRVGYTVTSIVFDTQGNMARDRQELADYYLRRKNAIREFLKASEETHLDLSWL